MLTLNRFLPLGEWGYVLISLAIKWVKKHNMHITNIVLIGKQERRKFLFQTSSGTELCSLHYLLNNGINSCSFTFKFTSTQHLSDLFTWSMLYEKLLQVMIIKLCYLQPINSSAKIHYSCNIIFPDLEQVLVSLVICNTMFFFSVLTAYSRGQKHV